MLSFNQFVYKRRMRNISSFIYESGMARFVKLSDIIPVCTLKRYLMINYLNFKLDGDDIWNVFGFFESVDR